MDTNASDTSFPEDSEASAEQPAPRKSPRTRRKKNDDDAVAPVAEVAASEGTASGTESLAPLETKPPRSTRRRTKPAAQTELALPAQPEFEPTVGSAVAESPEHSPVDTGTDPGTGADEQEQRKPVRTRRTRKSNAAELPVEEAGQPQAGVQESAPTSSEDTTGEAAEAPKAASRRRRASGKAAPVEAPEAVPAVADAADTVSAEAGVVEADELPKRVRSTRSRTRKAAQDVSGDTETPKADVQNNEPQGAAGVDSASDPEQKSEEAASGALDPFRIPAVPDSPVSLLFHAPDLTAVVPRNAPKPVVPVEEGEEDAAEEEESGRSRRRNRRTRNRGRASDTDAGNADSEPEEGDPADSADAAEVTSRRRRRRRRGEEDLELTGGQDDDPPNTITRVRAPRQSQEAPPSDRVTSVKGSTRLEAKKQRRRESRDSGRRRHVITEAEFLARRESVDRQMVVRQREDRIQIAVMEDGVLAEHFVSKTQQDSLIGNVYLGKVQNVLPSMEAAFVDIGRGRNAVLYAGEVNWDAAGLDGQPRRIELALKSGDSVLVQVTKDPVGHKGARLTSQISLPGRYLVYVPGGSMTGISRKLPDVERNRLKRILKDRLPENAGVIVRTAAEGASEEELTHDINRLRSQWETIEGKASSTKTLAPELLYGEPDLTIKVVRDVFNEDFSKLIVSGEEAWDTIEAYVMYVAPDLVGRLEKWTQKEDIFAARRIDEQIHKALDRKVFLPSGGSLVIDRTEAMTVVDVNTGKFTGSGGNLEETVTKNNLEAAEEVVRQLRLRDIGGIIVIDFIDMVLEANRDLVLRRLVECLGRDRTKHQVAEVTSLGLVQMTRKRMGTGLLEVFGENCEHCGGRGVVTHDEPVEHRSHVVSSDNHQQHLRQEKMTRSERKRNRSKSQPVEEPAQVHVPEPKVDDAERAARAEAARAALANIAAATHAAHEHDHDHEHEHGHDHDHEEQPGEQEPSSGPVLTINGETVTIPRGDAVPAPAAEAPRLTLESLTQAFDRHQPAAAAGPLGDVEQERAGSDASAPGSATEDAAPKASSVPAQNSQAPQGRRNRRRAASSAQGSTTGATIERGAAEGSAAAGTQHVAQVKTAEKPVPAEEPMILGVGVPASEL